MAAVGGVMFGLGLVTISLVSAARGQLSFTGRLFAITALGCAVGLLVIRILSESRPVKFACTAAIFTSVPLLATGGLFAPGNHTKATGFRAQMHAELLSIRDFENQSYADSGRFTDRVPPLTINVIARRLTVTAGGWNASVTHEWMPRTTCVIYGGAASLAPATEEGKPACATDHSFLELVPAIALLLGGVTMVVTAQRLHWS